MSLTVNALVEEHGSALQLAWSAGRAGGDRIAALPSVDTVDQVGYLNLIHPHRIQVLGHHEIAYYNRLEPGRREHVMQELLRGNPPALIVADGLAPPEGLRIACEEGALPLLTSPLASARAIEVMRHELARAVSISCSVHGVLMDVLGMGVLISGDSGVGKSELALELISRGHGLVADDVVEFRRISPTTVEGRCPPMLQGLLEVRGLGLLDIKTVFGETAVRRKMRLKLIVHLARRSTMDEKYERLPLENLSEAVLGVRIRKVVIPVAAGRNLAVLTEAAVRNAILQLRGIDTTREFVVRQQKAIDSDSE
ncbi:MAG TPA: HPr(Ser) kinase/phosphatase [Burkholderiaceae bacterium]|jgi:HPr kinase/phosphorylase|nr:HPr(Ser) kinase/phosphatase [Burkholderiaceae bacterium]